MDPSSGRDRKLNASPSEPENPFIRFKNFADSQVSSLLQGIIGLPSAFSKRSPEDNRWADIDEDLRRRDQLQARQKLLEEQWRGAEAVKANGNSALAEGEIPVKKTPHYQASQTSGFDSQWQISINGKESSHTENKDGPNSIKDIPLYSPVTRELFDHGNPTDALHALGLGVFGRLGLSSPTADSMGMIKLMMLGILRSSPFLHSEYSLLPYLVFSPYSPIKLETEAEISINQHKDKFQYCAAFEDLIRISQGGESSVLCHNAARISSDSMFSDLPGMHRWWWIFYLYDEGLLQQKKRRVSKSNPDFQAWGAIDGFPEKSDLDMFDHIQGMLGSKPSAVVNSTILGNLFARDGRNSNIEKEAHRDFQLQVARALDQQHNSRDQRPETSESVKRVEPERPMEGAKCAPAAERIVSTSTTTDRITHEDGTVETSVTIWKRFDDGRETTIKTTHTEEPGWDDKGQSSWPVDASKQEEKVPEKEEKKEKKGWFWS